MQQVCVSNYIEQNSTDADLLQEPAPTGAPAFTPAELAAMFQAVEIGLRDAGNAVELPGRKAALARLFEVAAKALAPRPANVHRKDESPMTEDVGADSTDAARPFVARGDHGPDDPEIPVHAMPAAPLSIGPDEPEDDAGAERARVAQILTHGIESGDMQSAAHLALQTDSTAADAIAILTARDSAAPIKPN